MNDDHFRTWPGQLRQAKPLPVKIRIRRIADGESDRLERRAESQELQEDVRATSDRFPLFRCQFPPGEHGRLLGAAAKRAQGPVLRLSFRIDDLVTFQSFDHWTIGGL